MIAVGLTSFLSKASALQMRKEKSSSDQRKEELFELVKKKLLLFPSLKVQALLKPKAIRKKRAHRRETSINLATPPFDFVKERRAHRRRIDDSSRFARPLSFHRRRCNLRRKGRNEPLLLLFSAHHKRKRTSLLLCQLS